MTEKPKVGLTAAQLAVKDLIEGQALVASAIPVADVQSLVNAYNHIEAFGPILDPTAWIGVHKTMPDHVRLAKAYLKFRQELESILNKNEGDPDAK